MENKGADRPAERAQLSIGQILLRILIYASLAVLGANIGAGAVQTMLLYFPLKLAGLDVVLVQIITLAVMVSAVSALYIYMMKKRLYRGTATAVYIPYTIAALLVGLVKCMMV